MDRLAEMNEYDSMFSRRLVDDDFLAAGYTPEEIQAYRGSIVTPSLTPQDIAAMEARYGALQEPDLTMRQRGAARVQDRLIDAGVDPYLAGSYGRRVMGDTAPTDGGFGVGLADFTPLGAIFGVQEGSRTAAQGYREGDPIQMGLGALEVGAGILEATPLTAAVGRGIAETASRMDPNTLYSVFGSTRGLRSAGGEATGIRAYHGSPHDFDRFSMDAIGSGEGAQVYGHGLYFAESEDVARGYRDALARGMDDTGTEIRIDGRTVSNPTPEQVRAARFGVSNTVRDLEARVPRLRAAVEAASPEDELGLGLSERDLAQMELDALLTNIENVKGLEGRIEMARAGRMYEVNIAANPDEFLDWDAPLSEQPEVVRRLGLSTRSEDEINEEAMRLMQQGNEMTGRTGGWADVPEIAERIDALNNELDRMVPNVTGESFYRSAGQGGAADLMSQLGGGSPQVRSQELLEAGIPGIRYLDAGSRGAGEGTRNFVVFDDSLIEVVRKYGIAGAAAILGVSSLEVEQAIAQNLPPSEWDRILVGPR